MFMCIVFQVILESFIILIILAGFSVERGYAEVSNRRTKAPPTEALITGDV